MDVVQDLKDNFKVIEVDNFLREGRGGYRAIPVQLLNKQGLSTEIQIRHKDLDSLVAQMHPVRDSLKTATPTSDEALALLRKQKGLEKQLNDKWNEIRQKEYFNEESTDNLDQIVADGIEIDEANNVTLKYSTNREFLEETVEIDNLLERLKDCK